MTRGPTSSVTTSSASPLDSRRLFFQPRYSTTCTATPPPPLAAGPASYHAGPVALHRPVRPTHPAPQAGTIPRLFVFLPARPDADRPDPHAAAPPVAPPVDGAVRRPVRPDHRRGGARARLGRRGRGVRDRRRLR